MRPPTTRAAPLLVASLLSLLWPRLLPAAAHRDAAPGGPAGSPLPPPLTAPPSFEANQGQLDPATEFLSRGHGFEVRLSRTGATLALAPRAPRGARVRPRPGGAPPPTHPLPLAAIGLRLTFAGASERAPLACAESAPGVANYLLGADPARWRRGVPLCRRVVARGLYPGIDLAWSFGAEGLEWDLRAAPAADLRTVRLRIDGAEALTLDADGDLVIHTAAGRLLERRPLLVGGARADQVAYRILGPHEVGLRIAHRRSRGALWIDPELSFSSFLGGSAWNDIGGLAQDESGNLYVAGVTYSADFPTVKPFQQGFSGKAKLQPHAFVSKIDPKSGTLLYSTYLGGSSTDGASGIAVDAAGNIIVSGTTSSADFPIHAAFQPKPGPPNLMPNIGTGFLTKLDPSGAALVFSTFFGSSQPGESAGRVAVDNAGNILIAGTALSADFPSLHAPRPCGVDAFVAKFGPGGALLFSTCFGGRDNTFGGALAVDALGNAYIAGETRSPDLPVTPGAFQTKYGGSGGSNLGDGYVAKFSPAGRLVYATYLGGPGDEYALGIAVDATGSAAVLSLTEDPEFPLVHPLQGQLKDFPADGFAVGMAITRLSPSGSSLIYSTFLDGSVEEDVAAISVGPLGDVCVTGLTFSLDYPLVDPIQRRNRPPGDAFISRLAPDGSQLLFSTLLGGSDITVPRAILCDPWGDLAVAGATLAVDFPVKHAFQPRFAGPGGTGSRNAFISVIAADPSPVTPAPLALLGGRFLVEAIWSDAAGQASGAGQGAALSADSGYFSFFAPGNLELAAKIVDGRAVNGRFWFFYGALSEVEYWLRVVDTATGEVRLYHNPRGHLASVADTAAFGGATAATAGAAPPAGPVSPREPSPAGAPRTAPPVGPLDGCGQGSLCLQGGRFEVRVAWRVPGLGNGAGTGVPLAAQANESGTFWFFDPNEVELALKILDARAVNGSFWLFYGALSDVEYDVVVTDTTTGRVKTYHNPAGTLASVADTQAF